MQQLNQQQQLSFIEQLKQDRISTAETSNQLQQLAELQKESSDLISQLKVDSLAIRGAIGENDSSLQLFSQTQSKIKKYFDKYGEETQKITSSFGNGGLLLNDKMPSPYSSAQEGTYFDMAAFDKILVPGGGPQQSGAIADTSSIFSSHPQFQNHEQQQSHQQILLNPTLNVNSKLPQNSDQQLLKTTTKLSPQNQQNNFQNQQENSVPQQMPNLSNNSFDQQLQPSQQKLSQNTETNIKASAASQKRKKTSQNTTIVEKQVGVVSPRITRQKTNATGSHRESYLSSLQQQHQQQQADETTAKDQNPAIVHQAVIIQKTEEEQLGLDDYQSEFKSKINSQNDKNGGEVFDFTTPDKKQSGKKSKTKKSKKTTDAASGSGTPGLRKRNVKCSTRKQMLVQKTLRAMPLQPQQSQSSQGTTIQRTISKKKKSIQQKTTARSSMAMSSTKQKDSMDDGGTSQITTKSISAPRKPATSAGSQNQTAASAGKKRSHKSKEKKKKQMKEAPQTSTAVVQEKKKSPPNVSVPESSRAEQESNTDEEYQLKSKRPSSSRKQSAKKETDITIQRPPTKGKDLSLLMRHNKVSNPTDNNNNSSHDDDDDVSPNTYLSQDHGVSDQNTPRKQSQAQGKSLNKREGRKSHLSTYVICKVLQHRGLLFDTQERIFEEAFTSIQLPQQIKSKMTLILTSSEQMLLLGGEDKGQYLGLNYIFSLVSQGFEPRQVMPEARVDFGSIYLNGSVYVVGGWREFYVTKASKYNIQTDEWSELASLNDEREDISLCIFEDKYLIAFGNVTTRGRRTKIPKKGAIDYTFERMNMRGDANQATWEVITVKTNFNEPEKLPTMKHMGCFNHYANRKQIILFGGYSQNQSNVRCFTVDMEKGELFKSGKLQKPDRFSNSIFFKKDELLYVVGEQFMHFYDLGTSSWTDNVYPLSAQIVSKQ